ncbi:MAG: DUF4233 domain-containing protein [Candidatus Phosphoribacter sp.]
MSAGANMGIRAGLVFYGTLGKFTWRMCAAVLVAQSIAVFFGALVARGIAVADSSGPATAYLLVGSALAVMCIVAAGLMRTAYGVAVGWAIQVATFASAVVVPMMAIVGVIFGALWVLCLVQGHRVDEVQRGMSHADPQGPPAPDGDPAP